MYCLLVHLTIFITDYFQAMKAIKHFVLILMLSIGLTVYSQPGNYYPPPLDVNYHNDTLTIFPPDSLPGAPVVILGYNIYVDSDFYDNVFVSDPEDIIDFVFDIHTLLPGQHEFCANVVYNEWISESTCDTGQVIYGFELPFLEDWSSGDFETLQWSTNSDHWVIETGEGNPAPTAVFQGEPGLTNYEVSLESFPMSALGMSNGKIWLDFNLKLEDIQSTGNEWLQAQVWNWSNLVWTTVAEYWNDDGSFNWSSEHINIKARAMNKVFRVRFLATGSNSSDIHKWSIDNIHVYRKCDGIYEVELEENIDYNQIDWLGYGGSCIDEWLHWDDGVNSGNSIGTGEPVEFEVAARWDHEQLEYLGGLTISEIAFFPAEGAASYSVRIWSGEGPDTLIIDQPVNSPVIGQWNYISLINPVIIDITKDLWVGYHVNTLAGYPAGVDDGPAIDGYGNMMYFEGAWQTLLEINPELNFNWNIACHIVPGPPPPDPDWVYNIYRQTDDGEFEFLATTPAWHYQDTSIILEEFYCYAVTAVWTENEDTCESSFQETACEYLMLGTGEPEHDRTLKIYPNPANDWLNIESDEEIREVRLYNLLGEEVLKLEIGNLGCQIDVSRLEGGIYFVKVVTEIRDFKAKILILR